MRARMEPYVYDVHVEMLHPVRAKPGHRLIVRPGHPERPVVVVRRTGNDWEPVRLGPPSFDAIAVMCRDGALSQRYPYIGRL
ncbi:hypothetical protein [Gemmatimonas sp.]